MTRSELAEAWIGLAEEEELRKALEGRKIPYDFGFLPNMARLISSHGGIGPAFQNLFTSIMFAPGHLDRREREMIAGVAAAAQDCFY